MNDGWIRIWKKVIAAYWKVPLPHFPGKIRRIPKNFVIVAGNLAVVG
jgi:hypothetical protein